MSDEYLTEEEVYKIITQNPPMKKELALDFIKSYGNGQVMAAFEAARKKENEMTVQNVTEKELEVRLERVNQGMNKLLHTLAEALS
jgi:hypothetical protein